MILKSLGSPIQLDGDPIAPVYTLYIAQKNTKVKNNKNIVYSVLVIYYALFHINREEFSWIFI